jgi:hypothetical protein
MSAASGGNCPLLPLDCAPTVGAQSQRDQAGDGTMSATKQKPRKKLSGSKRTREKSAAAKAAGRSKRFSALDAAAKVLAEWGKPMTTREMIEAMAAKGYWTSPAGATPWSTLYSSILREVTLKGKDSRFVKTKRGRFSVKA